MTSHGGDQRGPVSVERGATIRVASAPVSFGVDEIVVDDSWMPSPDDMLDWMVDIGYEGTELGPPGFLGTAEQVRQRLSARSLHLVGAFLPQHLSRDELGLADRAWLLDALRLIRDGVPDDAMPLAILSDHFDEPDRLAYAGQIADRPDTWLSARRFDTLISNLHRAAELCRSEGFEVVLHPHAGTYIETKAEIAQVVERMDPSLVGLCLDTGHFAFGGADPTAAVHDYHEVIRHVHIKDCASAVIGSVRADGGGLEEALKRGVFTELGRGDSGIDSVISALRDHDYTGWIVVEQDRFLGPLDTPTTVVAAQRRNRDYLRRLGL